MSNDSSPNDDSIEDSNEADGNIQNSRNLELQETRQVIASLDLSSMVNPAEAFSQFELAIRELNQTLDNIIKPLSAINSLADSLPLAQLRQLLNVNVSEDFVRYCSILESENRQIIEMASHSALLRKQAERAVVIVGEPFPLVIIEQLYASIRDLIRQFKQKDLDWQFLPKNIPSSGKYLMDVAELTARKGLPLAWIPRTEIIDKLIEAKGSEEDLRFVLHSHATEITDDCWDALNGTSNELTNQCRLAINTFRGEFETAAQSHAANIIDSIVIGLYGKKEGRTIAKNEAQKDYNDLPLRYISDNLTLRPLISALESWYPDPGTPIPDRFNRHATAHAVGRQGIFSRDNALVAIMLATSLTVNFGPRIRWAL